MTTILQLQTSSLLESNIRFYLQEINFLIKNLTKEYSILPCKEKIRALDTFWKAFEQNERKLKSISERIDTCDEKDLTSEFSIITEELKSVKQRLYDYLESISDNHI